MDRRSLIVLLATLAPALASRGVLAQSAPASGTVAGALIDPPARPMVYSRRLEREMTGDARFVVDRRFSVLFSQDNAGFRIEGEQIGVAVEAPARLAPLAEMERARVETGLFPLDLSPSGLIRSAILPDPHEQVEEVDQARAYVLEMLETQRLTDNSALKEFVAALDRAGGHIISALPVDLFAPAPGERSATAKVALPGGLTGRVSTRFVATRNPATGLMDHATREVVTAIEGESRRTIETFALAPAPQIIPAVS